MGYGLSRHELSLTGLRAPQAFGGSTVLVFVRRGVLDLEEDIRPASANLRSGLLHGKSVGSPQLGASVSQFWAA